MPCTKFGARRAGLPLASLAVALAVAGCLGEPDRFAKRGARFACKRIEACNREFFDTEYSGEARNCRDDIENNSQFAFDALEAMGCAYQPEQARACIKVARRNTDACDAEAEAEIKRACAEVFDCAGPGGAGEPQ